VAASEAILGYRLRQYHLGVVTWITGAQADGNALGLLERATGEVAAQAGCDGRLMFVPQDESSAYAWLSLGGGRDVSLADVSVKGIGSGERIQFAFGEPALGVTASGVPISRRSAPRPWPWRPGRRARRSPPSPRSRRWA
jgi:hypothetical protein